jgi:hypothetical protein
VASLVVPCELHKNFIATLKLKTKRIYNIGQMHWPLGSKIFSYIPFRGGCITICGSSLRSKLPYLISYVMAQNKSNNHFFTKGL